METPTKPLRGMAIIRRMVEIKEEAQRDAVASFQNDPEVRAMYERLKQKTKNRRVRN